VDTRVVAATSRDLDEMVKQGGFRRDLLYRLSVVTLKVPPLRERREDIPELAESYVGHFAVETGREVKGIGEEAMQALMRYDWPGNVRELINVIERAILLCKATSIEVEDLPHTVRLAVDPASLPAVIDTDEIKEAVFPRAWFEQPLREAREYLVVQFEKAYLCSLLKDSSGRIDETARRAGITTRALFDKMQRYALKKEDFKPRTK
jgi:DNA-binding NtrC family response regulator